MYWRAILCVDNPKVVYEIYKWMKIIKLRVANGHICLSLEMEGASHLKLSLKS